ncbi:MAG: disulfide bond formation protein B [Alphaproteobacteria bacterium]|nr:disulfide bond formation protein B [Alphaproteobacteria bacterium]
MNVATLSSQLQRGTAHPLFPGAAIAALGLAIIGGAYVFEYLVGLKPCPLCLEQRVPWYVLIVLGGVIVGASNAKAPRMVVIALFVAAIGVALWSVYLGGYHTGVEYKWWPGPQTCSGSALDLPTGEGGLLNDLSSSEIVRCDEIPWALFGLISLAGFNFLFSLVAVGLAAFGLRTILSEGH